MVEAISPLTMSVNDLHAEVTRAIRLPYVSLRVVAMGSRRPPPQDMTLSAHKMWGDCKTCLGRTRMDCLRDQNDQEAQDASYTR